MSRRKWIVVGVLAVLLGCGAWVARREVSFRQSTSPDGKFHFVVGYRWIDGQMPHMPGDAGGNPGYAEIFSADGRSYGRAELPMMMMAYEFKWGNGTARIPLLAEWNLEKPELTWIRKGDEL